MALTKVSAGLAWTGGATITAAAGADAKIFGDAFTLDQTTVAAQLQVEATVSVGPGTGDIVNVYLQQHDGTDYDTDKSGLYLFQLDVYQESLTWGSNASRAKKTIEIPAGAGGQYRLMVKTSGGVAVTNTVTMSGVVREQRSA